MSEKVSKGRFLVADMLQTHTNEEKGKEKRQSEEEERSRREKKDGATQKFFLAVTSSKIQLEVITPVP